MMLTATSQIHFDQVDRDFSRQQRQHVGVSSAEFVMRVQNGDGCYRLIAAAGSYRPDNGGELIGYCHEHQEMVHAVVLAGG